MDDFRSEIFSYIEVSLREEFEKGVIQLREEVYQNALERRIPKKTEMCIDIDFTEPFPGPDFLFEEIVIEFFKKWKEGGKILPDSKIAVYRSD